MTSNRTQTIVGITALLTIALGTFLFVIPHVDVDRVQEGWYLGVPYTQIEHHQLAVTDVDPFPENGPQAVYSAAAILYSTGSLVVMRIYQSIFSLLVLGLLFYLFFRIYQDHQFSWYEVAAYLVIFSSVWFSIPLALVYPVQVNGMTAGFACLLLGLLVFPQSTAWGMFCFGWAFSFKGQYLGLLPGFIMYVFLIDKREKTVSAHLVKSILSVIMFFAPKTIILAGLWKALGLFPTGKDLWQYALDGPILLFTQLQFILGHVLGKAGAASPEAATRRAVEYSGYGLIAWGHVMISVLFCIGFTIRSIWKQFRKASIQIAGFDKGLTVLAWGGLFYWINFLFFYRFPYWYNVFAVIFLNIFLAAALVYLAVSWISARAGKRWGSALLLACSLFALGIVTSIVLRAHYGLKGNSLEPYDWMQ